MNGRDLLYLIAVAVLVAWALTERWVAKRAEERAFDVDTPIDLWPVSNVTVTDDWPPAVREWTEAAARDRHPVGKGLGLRVVAGGGES